MAERTQQGVNLDTHLRNQSEETPLGRTAQDLGSAPNTSSDDPSSELVTMVDGLLDALSTKFANASAELYAKMDDMSRRLDNLEALVVGSQTEKESDKSV